MDYILHHKLKKLIYTWEVEKLNNKKIFSIFILFTLLITCIGVASASDFSSDMDLSDIDDGDYIAIDDDLDDGSDFDDDSDMDDDSDFEDDFDDESEYEDDDSDYEEYNSDYDEDWDDDDSDYDEDWDDEDWDDDSDWEEELEDGSIWKEYHTYAGNYIKYKGRCYEYTYNYTDENGTVHYKSYLKYSSYNKNNETNGTEDENETYFYFYALGAMCSGCQAPDIEEKTSSTFSIPSENHKAYAASNDIVKKVDSLDEFKDTLNMTNEKIDNVKHITLNKNSSDFSLLSLLFALLLSLIFII